MKFTRLSDTKPKPGMSDPRSTGSSKPTQRPSPKRFIPNDPRSTR